MATLQNSPNDVPLRRVRLWYGLILLIVAVFGIRLFYVQIIRHDHYRQAALSDQLKQYQIPAERGIIRAHDANGTVPIVLNQKLYTIYADPTFIKQPELVATSLAAQLGGQPDKYLPQLKETDSRYEVMARRVSKDAKNKILAYKYPGIGAQEQSYRTYPQGTMAAQLLGFVNSENKGAYGIEQALNQQLAGSSGELRAITDVHGVPLAANTDNISKQAVSGDDITLTIDVAIQHLAEESVKAAQEKTKAESATAVVMDPNTGAIKAMANYPSFDPAHYNDVEDSRVFNNRAVSFPIEIGSVMKTLTTAAALNQGVITPTSSYYDPSKIEVDGYTIRNIEEDGGPGQKDIADILDLSLNTGAIWELKQMGGGEINLKARQAWYNYLVSHYMFSHITGVEQGYEASGYVPQPKDNGAGINLTYANTAFGQAMTATALQLCGAMSAMLNGGTYYQPRLVDSITNADGSTEQKKPIVKRNGVVSPKVSSAMIPLMENVVRTHYFVPKFDQNRYSVGGKTGTAQIAKPGGGGYLDNEYNGSYVGFVGGDKVQYVIAVFVIKPQKLATNYAGTGAAQPLFAQIAHGLIDGSFVSPRD